MLSEHSIEKMNSYGKSGIPFLFVIDFDGTIPYIAPLSDIENKDILFDLNGITNSQYISNKEVDFYWKTEPCSFDDYSRAFDYVKRNLELGNSYLTNLTFPTEIKTNLSLKDIYHLSEAKYRLYFENKFTVFSPEIFVKIIDNKIFSFPMKGTIDADIKNAKSLILNDPKEIAEHNTIVDLIRNDLSMVAKKVKVDFFRYIDHIQTSDKNLLQVSSKISGDMPLNWQENIGNIFATLLPAGSICGAPKVKTLEIIKTAENYNRGYYTGVMGLFDGESIDSGVMIRFVERTNNKLTYKSGGGVTVFSNAKSEYQELIDKIYVPISTRIHQD